VNAMMLRQRRHVKIALVLQQKRNAMNQNVRLVIPAAPVPGQASGAQTAHRAINAKGIRLGVLDNSKGNADHLLKMIVDGVRAQVPLASVAFARKPYVSMAAPPGVLDQLAQEADIVISAMAD
jgi:hypothetical protein